MWKGKMKRVVRRKEVRKMNVGKGGKDEIR